MQDTSEETYQIATLVVVVITVLLVVADILVFINPRIALNPFKPPLEATATLAVAAVPTFPPTWTPQPTDTAVPTPTATSSPTPTLTPTPTSSPTPAPSATRRPAARPPGSTAPTAIPFAYAYKTVIRSCTHSGTTAIKGQVTSGGNAVDGIHVRLATGSDTSNVVDEQTVKRDTNGNTVYAFVFGAPSSGSFAWHVWAADAEGNALSDPNMAVTINTLPADDPESCWLAVVDFVQ